MTKIEKGATIQDVRSFPVSNAGLMRPFIDKSGQPCVMSYKGTGRKDDIKNYEKRPVSNAVLRYDEWRTLDEAVVRAGQERLVGFGDLRDRGLVFPLNNAMATTVLTYERLSEAMEAVISIDPVKRAGGDQVDFETAHLPIPVIHSDYSISDRVLQEARNRGQSLDTLNAEAASRKVTEKLEDMLFGTSSSLTYGGGTIYTYLTEPNINTVSFNSSGDYWDDASKTGADIIDDVITMKQKSIDDRHFGPWMLYIPTNYDTTMDKDYDSTRANSPTIRQRIEAINGILGVKVVDRLTDDVVLLVQLTRDVVDVIDGLAIQNVEWNTEGGFIHNYKVMTIQIPRIKSDYNDRSGIVKLS